MKYRSIKLILLVLSFLGTQSNGMETKKRDLYEPESVANKKIKREPNKLHINNFPIPILCKILGDSIENENTFVKFLTICKHWSKVILGQYGGTVIDGLVKSLCAERLKKYEINQELYFSQQSLIYEQLKIQDLTKFDPKRTRKDFADNLTKLLSLKNEVSVGNNQIPLDKVGTRVFSKEGFYEGELNRGKPTGVGCLYKRKVGLIYVGDFEEGKPWGKGIRFWPNGDKYEGPFVDSKRDGRDGKLFLTKEGIYLGEWKNDKREGEGTMTYSTGNKYSGSWRNDMPNGFGILESRYGSRYKGAWVDSKREGHGVFSFKNGTYTGDWKNNNVNGNGVVEFANGDKYQGEILNNLWHGKGKFTWADGNQYEGEYCYGKREGKGKFVFSSGGCSYVGQFMNNKPHGEGVINYKNGHRYEGGMQFGKCDGNFQLFDKNNQLYLKGISKQGKMDGEGLRIQSNETEVNVIFMNKNLIKEQELCSKSDITLSSTLNPEQYNREKQNVLTRGKKIFMDLASIYNLEGKGSDFSNMDNFDI